MLENRIGGIDINAIAVALELPHHCTDHNQPSFAYKLNEVINEMIKRIIEDTKVITLGTDYAGYIYSTTARIKLVCIYFGIILAIAGAYTAGIHRIEDSFPEISTAISQHDPAATAMFDTIIGLEFSIRVVVYHTITTFRDLLSASITYLQQHPLIAVVFGLMIFYMIKSKIKSQIDW